MAFNLKGDGLRVRAQRSFILVGLSFGASNLLRLGGNLILTRILFPEAFGIMALVQVVLTGLRMFSDVGIRSSIVQNERGNDPLFLDTAWVFQIIRGFILWGLTWVLAAPVAAFYEAPILEQLLPVAGLTAVFQGFTSTKLALANRNLMMGRVTAIEIGTSFLGLVVLVILALVWESVWALAIGGLVGPFLTMVLSHTLLAGHSNKLRFEWAASGSLFKFGKFIFISTLAGFLISSGDRAILGKYITLSDLALYNIAFMLATLPMMAMRKISDIVLFPLYSRRPPGESTENFRNIAKARFLVLGTVLVLFAPFAVFGHDLISLLYDTRYEDAGILVILIAISSMSQVVTGGYGEIMLAAGDSRRFAILLVSAALLQTGVLFLGVIGYGAIGAALAPLAATILFYPVFIRLLRPYGGWIPAQDIMFTAVACCVSALAIWYNFDLLSTAFAAASGTPD